MNGLWDKSALSPEPLMVLLLYAFWTETDKLSADREDKRIVMWDGIDGMRSRRRYKCSNLFFE